MTFLVFSDSHGDAEAMLDVASRTRFDALIHLGDGVRDAETLAMAFPDKDICVLKGNNDWYADAPLQALIPAQSVRLFACHGHTLGVRDGTERLVSEARKNGCAAALFGHTHTAVNRTENGLLLLNPGSVSYGGTYALLTVNRDKAEATILQR